MKEVEIDLSRFGARLKADVKRTSAKIRRAVRKSAFALEVMVAAKTPVDEGNTRAAWRTNITPDGASVDNDSPVVLFLEDGTRPHTPPLLPIVQWLARKDGLGSVSSLDDAPPGLIGRALAVQDSIALRGTPAHKMMESSIPDARRILDRNVRRELGRDD